ncbi:MAG: hypothetical protein AB1758_25270, partial [Candidatus Eremiobacterota bacterium]
MKLLTSLVWRPGDPAEADLGGKGAALARLAGSGFPVPPFVVVRAAASGWQDALPPEFERHLREALAAAGLDSGLLAVRSSALGEDSRQKS